MSEGPLARLAYHPGGYTGIKALALNGTRPIARFALALLETKVRRVGEGLLFLSLPVLAGLSGFGVVSGPVWASVWIGLFLVEWLYTRLGRGSNVEELLGGLREVNGSFAGGIDTLLQKLERANGRFSEEAAKPVCVAMLNRTKRYAAFALSVKEGPRMRVTLAVPWTQGMEQGVRVWCYDEPYNDRRWSFFPFGGEGAAKAFETGETQIIDDVWKLTLADAKRRAYRSVVSIPVTAGGPSGRALGVLNIDAEPPKFFTAAKVERLLIPLLAPVLNTVALVLVFRNPEETYEFGH